MVRKLVIILTGILLLTPLAAQDMENMTEEQLAEMARQLNNPIGSFWNLVWQNNTTGYQGELIGDDTDIYNTLNFQPVLPVPIGNLNLISRPVLPLVWQPKSPGSDSTVVGVGDIAWSNAVGPQSGPLVWALGIALPTASEDIGGFDAWTAGPVAYLLWTGKPWFVGVLYQQFFDFAGVGNGVRQDVNFINAQYFIIYMLPNRWQIQMTPNVTYDFNAANADDALTFPVGLGVGKTTGPWLFGVPWSFQLEAQYMVVAPKTYGQRWNIRFVMKQVLNSPFL